MILWLKAFHVVFVVTWFAGLFYLPRLFVYHAVTTDAVSLERFVVMERRLYAIMSLGAGLAILFGIGMIVAQPEYLSLGWLRVKLVLVLLLVGYHGWCRVLMRQLREGRAVRSQRWYRWFNEAPSLLLIGIVVLAVVKPSFG
ncbi:MAG TPA: protoporphyrinogen oxidase HemJ [Steroidobacteraceae bacterium]|nr:protoporphyrinogen oxidase HemJ [Steroidobacteraceae bacterium]